MRPKRLPIKRIHENIRKLLETVSEEFIHPSDALKQEKLEISSEDTLEEPMEQKFFSMAKGKKNANENLFEEELKRDEEENEFGY